MQRRAAAPAPDRASPFAPALRWAVPVLVLVAFGTAVLLWVTGHQALVNAALRGLGVEPGTSPFLDTAAILAAVECHGRAIDIYQLNPCDPLGRPHVYSPLWLTLLPSSLGTSDTLWVGGALALAFVFSLAWLLQPRDVTEATILGFAVFSPMVLYAVERANNDLLIFCLVVCAGAMQGLRRRPRLCSYAVILVAALLKYYPAILLSLVL